MTPSPYQLGVAALVLVALLMLAAVLEATWAHPGRAGQRLSLWLVCLVFTFYGPALSADPQWSPFAWAAAVNEHGGFKDLWLALIGMLVFSLSNIMDNLVRSYQSLSKISQFLVPITLASYFILIMIGMHQYSTLTDHALSYEQFLRCWRTLCIGVLFGPFVELMIVLETSD